MPFDDRHRLILPGSGPVPFPERSEGADGEPWWSMFRRRRNQYRIRLAARLLLSLGR
jgi:hypothetical protein